MNSTRKFFGGLLAGLVGMLSVYAAVFHLCLGVPTASSRWAFEITTKKLSLSQAGSSPQLLLVGGSSVLFDISAQEIERQTGWRTINMGTHAALGGPYILRMAQQSAKPGDTVLLVLEYELYLRGSLSPNRVDDLLIDYVMSRDLAFYHGLTEREKLTLFMMVPTSHLWDVLKSRFHPRVRQRSDIYDVSKIDAWGDQLNHPASHQPMPMTRVLREKSILGRGFSSDAAGFAVIESFCHWAETNHVRVLATYPNLCDQPEYHTAQARKTATLIRDFFRKQNVPVLENYDENLLPPNHFFDTCYHLTSEAALEKIPAAGRAIAAYPKSGG